MRNDLFLFLDFKEHIFIEILYSKVNFTFVIIFVMNI